MLSNDVIQPNANKLTFVMKSDPRIVDSDRDGLSDYEEIDTYNTNPLKSDITITNLSNPNYINIDYIGNHANYKFEGNINASNINISFGGNQSWTYNFLGEKYYFNSHTSAENIANHGCGLIATLDTLLYLGRNDNSIFWKNNMNAIYDPSTQLFNYEMYMDYLQQLTNNYASHMFLVASFSFGGMKGNQIASLFNSANNSFESMNYVATWENNTNPQTFLYNAKEMLKNDIPCIFSFWKFNPFIKLNICESLPLYTDETLTNNTSNVSGHYMVITKIIEYSSDLESYYNDDRFIVLEVSSWGKRYYINGNKYAENLDAFTNMLYLNAIS